MAATTTTERTPLLATAKAAENRDPATVSTISAKGAIRHHEGGADSIRQRLEVVQMPIRTRNLILGSVWMVSCLCERFGEVILADCNLGRAGSIPRRTGYDDRISLGIRH